MPPNAEGTCAELQVRQSTVRRSVSSCRVENGPAAKRIRRFTQALVYVVLAGFVLFLGYTQVYANVRAFGWIGFAALLIIAPLVSWACAWFTCKNGVCE